MKTALVLDDSVDNTVLIKKELEEKGFKVETALTVKKAKEKVLAMQKQGHNFELIVADYDIRGNSLRLHDAVGGFRFALWCKRIGVKSRIVLHSTSFDASHKVLRAINWPIRKTAEKAGITVQGKNELLDELKRKTWGKTRAR